MSAADQVTETARANLYLVLARAFSSPLDMDENDPMRLREVIPQLPEDLRDGASAVAECWERGLSQPEALLLSYSRLFLGPFEILASPYASFYLESDQRLMGAVSQTVASAYMDAGLDPGPGPREAPDHVALEWEFMYFLSHQFLVSGDDQWRDQRRSFVTSHLARWMPQLVDAIRSAGEHSFYTALATLLADVLEDADRLEHKSL